MFDYSRMLGKIVKGDGELLRYQQKCTHLKSSRNKKDLNDVTAALFSVSFSQLPAAKKTLKTGQL